MPDTDRTAAWEEARGAWLAPKPTNTARAYARAWADFTNYLREYFGLPPWRAEAAHARAWAEHLASAGQASATIKARLAGASGLYAFVLARDHWRTACYPTSGRRASAGGPNPFAGDVTRPQVAKFTGDRPLSANVVQRMLGRINTDTVTGARDYALLITCLLTGHKPSAVVELCGRDLSALPDPVRSAIDRYLACAGRVPSPSTPIWLPLSLAGCRNFSHVDLVRPQPQRPISTVQVNNVLRKRLKAAGVAHPEQYTASSLRATFAGAYHAARPHDVAGLSRRLGHREVSTTLEFLAGLHGPVEVAPEVLLAQAFGILA